MSEPAGCSGAHGRRRVRRSPAWLGLDVLVVVAFVLAGSREHDSADGLAGLFRIGWPFLAGLLLGWVLTQAWRAPVAVFPVGLVVWVSTVGGGMLLRTAVGEGTAASFILVTAAVLGVLTLGWRLVHLAVSRLRRAGPSGAR
ncbi:MAG TPA: DUF3054 domain-containing protein [Jiangellaceae bacterium]|nr:DUF3054 domain-containing protein [Jiangellaceae bacterium]